jgi:hypothetical protein
MGFFQDLFGIGKKRDVRQTTDDELNAILVPLRDAVADFKDRTQISHTHILPAINAIGVKLLVQSRGLESAQRLYRAMINDLDSRGGMAVGSHIGISKPPVAPEMIAELNAMLWKIANDRIAAGKPTEHVAQAYYSLATMVAERAGNGDPWLVKYLMAEAARELKIDFTELDAAKIEQRVTAEQEADAFTREASPTYHVADFDAQNFPASHGTIWLEANEIWFSFPSKDFSIKGHWYHIPGGAVCFQRDTGGREQLLKFLRKERDFWARGNEAEWIRLAEASQRTK